MTGRVCHICMTATDNPPRADGIVLCGDCGPGEAKGRATVLGEALYKLGLAVTGYLNAVGVPGDWSCERVHRPLDLDTNDSTPHVTVTLRRRG